MWVEFSTWSTKNNQMVSTTRLEVNILHERSATIELLNDDCDLVHSGDLCTSEFRIQNTGNYQDSYEITWDSSLNLEVQSAQTVFNLLPGVSTDVGVTYTVDSGLPAGQMLDATLRMMTSDGIEMDSDSTTIEVDVDIAWEINAQYVSMDDLDNVTVAYTLRNIGNADDGLDVTLICECLHRIRTHPSAHQ